MTNPAHPGQGLSCHESIEAARSAGGPCVNGECGLGRSAEAFSVKEILARFELEARTGVCHTGRYLCSFFTWGNGPPLLFIPGLSDDARSFVLPSALLADSFRCISYDLPTGRGDGACLPHYTHADLVEDVFALLDHLQVKQSYVLGSSFGSTIALAALHTRPDRLPRAVLQGSFARRSLAPAEVLLARLARYWPGSMRLLPFRNAILKPHHSGPFAGRAPEFWDYLLTRWGVPPIAAVAQRALLLHRVDLRPILPAIHQPVLLVCGDQDPLVGKDCEQDLLDGLPHAVRVEIGQCGHSPQFSHPEVLAELVRQFLTPPGTGQ